MRPATRAINNMRIAVTKLMAYAHRGHAGDAYKIWHALQWQHQSYAAYRASAARQRGVVSSAWPGGDNNVARVEIAAGRAPCSMRAETSAIGGRMLRRHASGRRKGRQSNGAPASARRLRRGVMRRNDIDDFEASTYSGHDYSTRPKRPCLRAAK